MRNATIQFQQPIVNTTGPLYLVIETANNYRRSSLFLLVRDGDSKSSKRKENLGYGYPDGEIDIDGDYDFSNLFSKYVIFDFIRVMSDTLLI